VGSGGFGQDLREPRPATGELLASVAEGDKEDINRAVAAARAAFEGPWSEFKPYERQALLLKIADLVEKHYDELSLLRELVVGRLQLLQTDDGRGSLFQPLQQTG
jgi:aldehyde dehydrogenase (NAD+)